MHKLASIESGSSHMAGLDGPLKNTEVRNVCLGYLNSGCFGRADGSSHRDTHFWNVLVLRRVKARATRAGVIRFWRMEG